MSWLCLITNTTTSCQWAKCGEDVEWGQCWDADILCCFFLSIIKCNQLPVNIIPTQHSPLVVNWKGLSALFGRNLPETLTALKSSFCFSAERHYFSKSQFFLQVFFTNLVKVIFSICCRKNPLLAERTLFWQKEPSFDRKSFFWHKWPPLVSVFLL